MKKILIFIGIIIIIITAVLIIILTRNKNDTLKDICNYTWQRTTDVDTENIRFGCDKSFSYYYGVGNPVEDSDLCESFSYNEKIITLNCDETPYNNKIEILSYDENDLELLINNEKRAFKKIK